eukprot:227425-Rhodomonas_salina.1
MQASAIALQSVSETCFLGFDSACCATPSLCVTHPSLTSEAAMRPGWCGIRPADDAQGVPHSSGFPVRFDPTSHIQITHMHQHQNRKRARGSEVHIAVREMRVLARSLGWVDVYLSAMGRPVTWRVGSRRAFARIYILIIGA